MKQFEKSNNEMDSNDHLKNEANLSYEAIFKNHDGLISHKLVHCFYVYDKLFSEYRQKNKAVTILEIGVDRGGSLEIWKKYFPVGSKIYGVDINPKCNKINFSENIQFHLGSASDRSFMEKTFKNVEFDIILDDGSHICSDVIETFEMMFPKLKNGGLYVVEDMRTSYLKRFGGGIRKKGTSIEYFKNFVEALHADFLHPTNFFIRLAKHLVPRFRDKIDNIWRKYRFNNIDNYAKTIENIAFYGDVCAIKKFSTPKNNQFKSVITGRENIDGVNCVENELEYIQRIKNTFGAE